MQTWPSRLLERSDAPLVYLAEGNRLFLGQKTSAMSIFGCGTGRITPEGHWSFALIFIGLCRLTGRAYPHLTFLVEVCVGRHLATRRTWSDVARKEPRGGGLPLLPKREGHCTCALVPRSMLEKLVPWQSLGRLCRRCPRRTAWRWLPSLLFIATRCAILYRHHGALPAAYGQHFPGPYSRRFPYIFRRLPLSTLFYKLEKK